MTAYLAILSARFRMLLQYRLAAVAGFTTQLFWGFIRIMILEAFYRSSTTPPPMSVPQIVSYVWLGQALFALFPFRVDADIRLMIRSGTVAYELVRPLDLYTLWFCRAVANRASPAALRAVPMFILAMLFFGLQPPASAASGLAFAGSTLSALLLGSALATLMSISLLWTISDQGIATLMTSLMWMGSGMVIPLPFFPDWAQPILNFLPFRGLADVPYRLYSGNLPSGDAVGLIAQQLAWTVALVILGRWLLSRGLRRVEVQGG